MGESGGTRCCGGSEVVREPGSSIPGKTTFSEPGRVDRRAADRGLVPQTAHAARRATTTLWDWAEKRKIAAHIVFGLTVYLTFAVLRWTLNFPYEVAGVYSGTDVAAIIAAVTGPWAILQGAMFKFYVEMVKNGHTQP